MGKVHKAMLKKRMESDQTFSTKEHLARGDSDFILSPSINRRRSPRRIHPRAETDLPITVIKNDFLLHGRVKNISRGGALVYLDDVITVGEKVFIAIKVDEFSNVITAEVEVARLHPVIGIDHSKNGIGLKYITLSKEFIRFFSGNFIDIWGENNDKYFSTYKLNYLKINSAKKVLSIIGLLFFIFIFYNIEKHFYGQIKSLEVMIVNIQNSVYTMDDKFNKLFINFDNGTPKRGSTIAPYLLGHYQNLDNFYSIDRNVSYINDGELSDKDSFSSQSNNQVVKNGRSSIGIGGLKVQNTVGNLEN